MGGFTNAELKMIKENLKCGYCCSTFVGSDSQARKVKYEKRTVYCSAQCRKTAIANIHRKEIPLRGPCLKCGEMFRSRTVKKYCSMDCYTSSDQIKKMLKDNSDSIDSECRAKIADKLRTGEVGECLFCKKELYKKKSKPKKYCNQSCYRGYMAERFDRFIANPESVALPQCYDEFMRQTELPCLVDGCNWKGKWLSVHVNSAHGIKAKDFKMMCGFNLGTGLVSDDTYLKLSEREKRGVVFLTDEERRAALLLSKEAGVNPYKSLEGIEHHKKSMQLRAFKALESKEKEV